jgi:ABC-2 type transport system ATP-binding protein
MVAKALINNPDLLILDEPTAGVDIELRRSLWEFLIEINKNGTTIILTTHYLEEAEKLCKNISIIDKGEIVKTSSMQSLLRELDTEIFIFDLKDQVDSKSISNSPFEIKILDTYQISVEINKSQSLNEIFRYLNENNLIILSMRNETNRLEELFLDLTEK